MVERSYPFTPARREALQHRVFGDRDLPDFGAPVDRVAWDDGCKVYFADGAWVTIRFSGTEPVLRVFAEAETLAEAERLAACVATHLGLED